MEDYLSGYALFDPEKSCFFGSKVYADTEETVFFESNDIGSIMLFVVLDEVKDAQQEFKKRGRNVEIIKITLEKVKE